MRSIVALPLAALACGTPVEIESITNQLAACAGSAVICDIEDLEQTPEVNSGSPMVFGDRRDYWESDTAGHFVVAFPDQRWASNRNVTLELSGPDGVLQTNARAQPSSDAGIPKLELTVDMTKLREGDYQLQARYSNITSPFTILSEASYRFTRSWGDTGPLGRIESGIPIHLTTENVPPNSVWPITTGVPFPRGSITEAQLQHLRLYENGLVVAAQIKPTARWERKASGSIKWIRLDFLARYDGTIPRRYVLGFPAPSPAPPAPPDSGMAAPLVTSSSIVVNTGIIRFSINRTSFNGIESAQFDEDRNGTFETSETTISQPSGPFVVDVNGKFSHPHSTQAQIEP